MNQARATNMLCKMPIYSIRICVVCVALLSRTVLLILSQAQHESSMRPWWFVVAAHQRRIRMLRTNAVPVCREIALSRRLTSKKKGGGGNDVWANFRKRDSQVELMLPVYSFAVATKCPCWPFQCFFVLMCFQSVFAVHSAERHPGRAGRRQIADPESKRHAS